jgi:CelD/BcsL family acetyltransferase involved in cellulose biosynthesis
MKTVVFTLQEQWAASRHLVQKNKKKYDRKREKNKQDRKGPFRFSILLHIYTRIIIQEYTKG